MDICHDTDDQLMCLAMCLLIRQSLYSLVLILLTYTECA